MSEDEGDQEASSGSQNPTAETDAADKSDDKKSANPKKEEKQVGKEKSPPPVAHHHLHHPSLTRTPETSIVLLSAQFRVHPL